MKRQKPHWLVMWLFQNYIKCRIWIGYFKRNFNYYFGAFAPLWSVTMLVKYYQLDRWNNGDKQIHLKHIEYAVNDKRFISSIEDSDSENNKIPMQEIVSSYYYYDITARSAWYFSTIGNDYDGYIQYAQYILPNDINKHLFNSAENTINVKYDTIEKQNDTLKLVCINNVILAKNGEYRSQTNNTPFIEESITFNTLSFLLDSD
jgi:hypothetical protein